MKEQRGTRGDLRTSMRERGAGEGSSIIATMKHIGGGVTHMYILAEDDLTKRPFPFSYIDWGPETSLGR